MSDFTNSRSIFEGKDEIIYSFLGLGDGETIDHKAICRRLISQPDGLSSFTELVSDLYRLIEENRSDHSPSCGMPSRQNWRLERQVSTLSPNNRSPEILLERAIALLGEERDFLADWYNQIPVASGLRDGRADKRAAIDLLRYEDGQAEFVELKWKGNTPIFAAFEILVYGLAYLFARDNQKTFAYQEKLLIGVNEVSLHVLAPHAYYIGYDLTWLERGLDEAVRKFAAKKTDGALSMGFAFLAFPHEFVPDFKPPFATGEEVKNLAENAEACRSLASAIRNLEPAFHNAESKDT